MPNLDPLNLIARLETDLGLPFGFFKGLLVESDWSFVVKSHAFLEAVLSHLLAEALSNDKLKPVFANLETSGAAASKLAFLDALDLLDKRDRRFIRKFSELRNMLVHDVTLVDFDLKTHFKSVNAEQRASYVEAFSHIMKDETIELDGQTITSEVLLLDQPKVLIWISIMAMAALIRTKVRFIQFLDIASIMAWYEKNFPSEAA